MQAGGGAAEGERENLTQAPHWAGSPMWDSIPGPWDHDLSRRQVLNHLNHPGAPQENIIKTGTNQIWPSGQSLLTLALNRPVKYLVNLWCSPWPLFKKSSPQYTWCRVARFLSSTRMSPPNYVILCNSNLRRCAAFSLATLLQWSFLCTRHPSLGLDVLPQIKAKDPRREILRQHCLPFSELPLLHVWNNSEEKETRFLSYAKY